ncbi:BMP family protein [Acetanaerobacterium sp. MSJ-12]|uniref:BMP family lipoprotein n=1 Tax=Acetanaerobacterium sp. MSJ-12 TaxID=2841535 RepID=UPI001C0E9BB2|nr:BMP family protein [Acetanaerobacterium sp. MSJ-12]MBU5419691.1 BMP family protein [Acetanaerobacterium sp. MSJ-12]
MFTGKSIKRILAALLAGCLCLTAFAGCGDKKEGGDAGKKGSDIKAAIIISGSFGTQSFQDVALAGCQKAADEFGFELTKVENVNSSDASNTIRSLIGQGVNMIISPNDFFNDAIEELAPENPDVCFISGDAAVPDLENVASAYYREQEAAFLLGALAGMLTESNKVAFIGHTSNVVMDRFEYGYRTGARYVNPNASVISMYTGSVSDVNKGKEMADLLYSQGVDYIAPAAAACNTGVFQSSKEHGGNCWTFGAADGQFHLMPDRILASQVKRIDNVCYQFLKDAVEGNWKGGQPQEMGLKEGGVDLLYTTNEELAATIPQDVKDRVEELRQKVVSGELKIPATKDEFAAFSFPSK